MLGLLPVTHQFLPTCLTAVASSCVFCAFPVSRILSFGTPSLTALCARISPSGFAFGVHGTHPPVKINKGAFPACIRSTPPSNLSTAPDHSPSGAFFRSSIIPLKTTIASAVFTSSMALLSSTPSTHLISFPLTNPVLSKRRSPSPIQHRTLFLKISPAPTRTIVSPIGRQITGRILFR